MNKSSTGSDTPTTTPADRPPVRRDRADQGPPGRGLGGPRTGADRGAAGRRRAPTTTGGGGNRDGSAAVLALPRLDTFPHGEAGDGECDDRVEPPPAEHGVGQQPDQDRGGEVGAQPV